MTTIAIQLEDVIQDTWLLQSYWLQTQGYSIGVPYRLKQLERIIGEQEVKQLQLFMEDRETVFAMSCLTGAQAGLARLSMAHTVIVFTTQTWIDKAILRSWLAHWNIRPYIKQLVYVPEQQLMDLPYWCQKNGITTLVSSALDIVQHTTHLPTTQTMFFAAHQAKNSKASPVPIATSWGQLVGTLLYT